MEKNIDIEEIRNLMINNIFNTLKNKSTYDNKINYCDEHAFERAKIIENNLYNQCIRLQNSVHAIYSGINVQELVKLVEPVISKCNYSSID
jgi:hypothetical protein